MGENTSSRFHDLCETIEIPGERTITEMAIDDRTISEETEDS